MSKIYEGFYRNIKKYPNKIFIYNLKKKFTGKDCLLYLKKTERFIKFNNIKSIGIKSINSFDWIILYLAADKLCSKVFIIKNGTSFKTTNKLKKTHNIDYIVNKIPKKIIKIKKKKSIGKTKDKRVDILFTSGTTDAPKGVIINENSFIHVVKILIKKFNHNRFDLEFLSMPFDHSFGLVRLRCCLYTGSQMLVNNGLVNFPDIYNFSKKIKITGLSLVPSGIELIKILLKKKIKEFNKNIKYFEIGSSAINITTRKWLKKNFKTANIIHHYGMTEASRSFLISRGGEDNLKSSDNMIGNIINGCEYKISNNPKGELFLKGKNLFNGYLDKNENKKKFYKEWFKTGDIVEKEKRQLKIVGRIDNQINIGGNKVQAEFIENIVENIQFVYKCLCYQIKDKMFNKRIALQIEKKGKIKNQIVIDTIQKMLNNYPEYYKPKVILFKKVKLNKNGKKIRIKF
jgi:long-subunit acyl-CoA synthetase (AMP-forming)